MIHTGRPQPGDVLEGRYRLGALLGRGGFGDVWRAEELLPGGEVLREVALKLLRVAPGSSWTAEARIIASLRHPALVTIYAAGLLEHGGRPLPFVAMELLIGKSLAALVDEGRRVPWRRVLAWAREAAAALDECHLAGVVHLDLKPANLFLAERGELKVLDFGIARQGQEQSALVPLDGDHAEVSTAAFVLARERQAHAPTASSGSRVVGTPGFMAPEILEDGEATAASDAYALAVCMVELITGALPLAVSSKPAAGTTLMAWIAEVHAATVHGRVRDLSGAPVPPALRELVLRWLRLDPMARGVRGGDLGRQLDEIWQRPFGEAQNPYRGLEGYTVEDEGRLVGREADAARLGRELLDERCVVLHGPARSGLGSLAAAGVVPWIARAFADGRDDWLACVIQLERDPDATVQRQLAAWLCERDPGVDPEMDAVKRLEAWVAGCDVGVVVLLDRLRWLEAAAEDGAVARLVALVLDGAPGLRLCGLAREEHIAPLCDRPEVARWVRPSLRFIDPLSPAEARDVVRVPLGGSAADAGVVDEVIAEVQRELGRDPRSLPLVSLALTRWWHAGCGPGAFEAQGRLVGPMCAHAEKVVAALSADDRGAAEWLLGRLLAAEGIAHDVDAEVLSESAPDPDRCRAVLERLEAEGLILRRRELCQLAHPELVNGWKRLQDIKLRDFDRLAFLDELSSAVSAWQLAGRPAEELWRGGRLTAAERRLAELDAALDADERAFVAACRAARRASRMVRGGVVLSLLAAILGVLWLQQTLEERAAKQQERAEHARHEAAVTRLSTRSLGTRDPYLRLALLAEALAQGAADPTIALQVTEAALGRPAARFLALEPVERASFPWDERWLLGSVGRHVALFDLQPTAGEGFGVPRVDFTPHADGLREIVAWPFIEAFVTRGFDGRLAVWRVRPDRPLALAALSPMRCFGNLALASASPVVACGLEDGLARWDLRSPDKAHELAERAAVLDVSPDGRWVAASRGGKLWLWSAAGGAREPGPEAVAAARFSPRDEVLAVATAQEDRTDVAAFDLRQPGAPLWSRRLDMTGVDRLVWDRGGVDLAVCGAGRGGRWLYLRRGARDPGDGPPPEEQSACEEASLGPVQLRRLQDYGALLAGSQELGPRVFEGGWRLKGGRHVTRDLVTFDLADRRLAGLVRHDEPGAWRRDQDRSVVSVVRDGEWAWWQVGEHVIAYQAGGAEVRRREGHLLGRCADGRVLAWRHADEGKRYQVFGLRHDTTLATAPRTPGLVLGIDAGCRRLFFQSLDGTLSSLPLDGKSGWQPVGVGGGGYVIDGYAYDARPSRGAGPDWQAGLWIALSSGSIVRLDGPSGALRPYHRASPFASAFGDGPRPGELLLADERGVVLRTPSSPDRVLLEARADRPWSDLQVLPSGRHVALAWPNGVAILDLDLGEVVGELSTPERGRLAPWDDDGSLLVWPFAFKGHARGEVLPFGPRLARAIADAASNLRVQLDPSGRAILRLR